MEYRPITLAKNITGVIVKNDAGLEVVFTSFGGAIYYIKYKGEYMTVTPKVFKEFTRGDVYHGKTIGPIPNRIRDGVYKINDVEYKLNPNEGNNTLHSGENGISNRIWILEISKNKEFTFVTYNLKNKHIKNGFIGNVIISVAYVIPKDEATIYVSYKARTDRDTLIQLTNHSYFCLGDENINNLKLTIPSDKYLETYENDLLPKEVKDIIPCLDFRKGKRIVQNIDDPYLVNHRSKGYDHHFYFNNDKPIIKLENKRFELEIKTNFSGTQIYSYNYETDFETFASKENIRLGIAIEPQDDLLNRQITKKKPGFYNRFIQYTFSSK